MTDLRSTPTPDLHRELADGLSLTAPKLTRLAEVVAELDRRGERLSIPKGLAVIFRRIANRELLPDVVVRFAGKPTLARKIGALPVAEQRRLLDDAAALEEFTKPTPRKRAHDSNADEEPQINEKQWLKTAKNATAKDLAALVAEMIAAHPDAATVWAALCRDRRVQKFANAG